MTTATPPVKSASSMTITLPADESTGASATLVYAPDNEIRIFGPPGTGKTTRLTQIIAELAREHGPTTIMVASFTRTAAQELVKRIEGIPEGQVKTLHAFGYAALGANRKIADQHIPLWNQWVQARYHGLASEFRLSLNEARSENDELLAERTGMMNKPEAGDKTFSQIQVMRARMIAPSTWPERMRRFWGAWVAFKNEHNLIDFMDMIELPLVQQLPPPGNPRFLILDEAQDFTLAEMTLARMWGRSMERVYVALDDDQSLYYFKGADPESCLTPDLPADRKIILAQSFRVPAAVHAYAQAYIQTVSRREPKDYRPRIDAATGQPVEGEVRWISSVSAAGVRAGSHMAPEILVRDAESHYLSQGMSVMFLGTCSYVLNSLKAVLRKSGIPFQNEYRRSRADWNPLSPANGVASAQRLLDFLRLSPDVHGAQARMWTIEEFINWTDALQATGVLKRGMKKEIDTYRSSLGDDKDVLARELNFDDTQLLRWMEPEALTAAFNQDLEWFEAHLAGSRRDGMAFPLAIVKKRGAKALLEPIRVTIGTIHSVKGGEADAVYLFPDISKQADKDPTSAEWSINDLASMDVTVRKQMQDDARRLHRDTMIRVMYVGMTRAKHSLIICPPAIGGPHIDLPRLQAH